MPNRLAKESSPYLQQHADNPVDWYPWGEEAFERAHKENKPVLLSIGYSACHWCHVMAHESFQNESIAALMNANFINIKVDREERPDLDHIYMEAVQAMGIGGGWPLTVFLTPDKKPFSGGTYFPPEDRYNMPGFPKVLQTIARVYQSKPENIGQITSQLAKAMQKRAPAGRSPVSPEILKSAWENLLPVFDAENAGFGDKPKFPQPLTLELLLRHYAAAKDSSALQMVEFTLEKMAAGGIYDQIGGGFHRYSTDDIWLVPHFEKMLYDNALLSRVYLHAYLAGGNRSLAQIAAETLDYVLREMRSPEGGFYSTQDADSEGVEGKYFLWTAEEIDAVLKPELAASAKEYFGITPAGNFEGSNILHVAGRLQDAAKVKEIQTGLLAARNRRVKPGRDEKVLTSWNGMLLQSLAEAALVLRRTDYLEAAIANAEFIRKNLVKNGRLLHVYKDGSAKIEAFLEDYAQLIQGLLVLHQASLDSTWLKWAIDLSEKMVVRFSDSAGWLFDTADNPSDLIVRPRNVYDGVVPSGPAGAVQVLLTLAVVTGRENYKTIAETNLKSIAGDLAANPLGFSQWLCAADYFLAAPLEFILVCKRGEGQASKIFERIAMKWLPNKISGAFDPQEDGFSRELPLFKGKERLNNKPTLFVCRNYACRSPLTSLVELDKELSLL